MARNETPQRAAIYARVNTDRDAERRLDDQVAACRAHCDNRGFRVDEEHVYREIASGAYLDGRPELERARQAMRRREFDVLVCSAADRIARNDGRVLDLVEETDRTGVRIEVADGCDLRLAADLLRAVSVR